ncbi:MAG TPA: hypothetical protein P5531_02195 [Bacteroidales bacterium]|nr:hypothetical protein [Bacteroidales bacterium]HSA43105.1 hypothetical protein [Bacteroidales bacterium]
MPFLTLQELAARPYEEASRANRMLSRTTDRELAERRLFLFYRLTDKERVVSMVSLIKSLRINVYLDYLEAPVLEGRVQEVLQAVKTRLYQSQKAILMATPHPVRLSGLPLDYGLNGRFQFTGNVAVFPVTEHPQRWDEKDMYRIYGYIQKKYSLFNYPDDWQVVTPEKDKISLKDWILR